MANDKYQLFDNKGRASYVLVVDEIHNGVVYHRVENGCSGRLLCGIRQWNNYINNGTLKCIEDSEGILNA